MGGRDVEPITPDSVSRLLAWGRDTSKVVRSWANVYQIELSRDEVNHD